jgi:hypothetical protein
VWRATNHARALSVRAALACHSWKRATDPETGAPKRFGFVEFAHAEGVLRALRVLRERPLASSEPLLVNVSSETQRFLDYHVAVQKSRRATIVAAPQLTRAPDGADDAQAKPVDAAAAAATAAADDASQEEALDKAALSAVQARAQLPALAAWPHRAAARADARARLRVRACVAGAGSREAGR